MASQQQSGISLPHIPDNLSLAQFMLDYHHEIQPTRASVPCLIDDATGRSISMKELQERTIRLATVLQLEFGIGDDDVAQIILARPQSSSGSLMLAKHTLFSDYPVALWAVHTIGGIVTCSNPQFTADELVYQLELAKATLLIVHSSALNIVLAASSITKFPSHRIILLDDQYLPCSSLKRLNYRSVSRLISSTLDTHLLVKRHFQIGEGKTKVALLCWSSGTTGKPKAVAISHHGLIVNIIQMAAHNQVNRARAHRNCRSYSPGDVALGVLPFYHVAGLVISLHFVVFCAMTLVVVPKYNFLGMLDSIDRHRITHLLLVPPQAITLSKHSQAAVRNHDCSQIKYVMIGAAPVSQDIQTRLCTIFPAAQIGQAYGLTEMTATISMISASQQRGPLGSAGRLLPGIEAQVIRSDGSIADFGEPGELFVRGPASALGYFNDESATRETFVNGWVRTGDEVVVNEHREVFVFDRLKELLKVDGFQVAPAELEGCLVGHPYVDEACVVGIPHPRSGELPLAYVVLSATALEKLLQNTVSVQYICRDIQKYVAERKIGYKHLKGGVYLIESIPKNGSGKLLRRILREKARSLVGKSYSEEMVLLDRSTAKL